MRGRSARFYAEDIVQCMEKIEEYLRGMSYAAFEKNDLVVDAVLRNLEVIGEAAKNVPAGVRKKHPGIPWKKTAAGTSTSTQPMRPTIMWTHLGLR